MTEVVKLDPAAVASGRTELDVTPFIDYEGVDWGDSAIESHMAKGHIGSVTVDYDVPNRVITIPLVLKTVGAVTFETIRRQLQAKAALFQREGGWLMREVNGVPWYADVVSATLKLGGHSLQARASSPVDLDAVLTLECVPDFYGAEVALDDMVETTAAELVRVLKLSAADAVIVGDYPARVRIVVDEDQGQSQLGLLWGVRCRHYSSAATAALAYEAEALTRLDTAAIATVAGASGGGANNVVQHSNLSTNWTPVLSTQIVASGHMTHTGTYRVWARVRSTSATPPRVRFVWDVGDLAFPTENPPQTIPGASTFYDVDLGGVRLDAAVAGPNRWLGQFQAIGSAGGENVQIDKLWFQPLDESAGRLVAVASAEAGLTTYSARDEFNQTAGALVGKTAPIGGNWSGAGDADDFTVETTGKTAQRTAVSDTGLGRMNRLGTGTLTAAALQVDFKQSAVTAAAAGGRNVFGRYVDASNLVGFGVTISGDGLMVATCTLVIGGFTSGIGTQSGAIVPVADRWYSLRAVVDAGGRFWVWLFEQGASPGQPKLVGSDTALATGGTLASGGYGIWDSQLSATANTRNYDNFAAWPAIPDAVLYASQSAELGTGGIVREDASGSAYGPVSHVIGDLPRIPPSGMESRPVELFLKATRGDFGTLPDSAIDDLSARVHVRPSYLFVPKQP